MSWQNVIPVMVRYLINDVDATNYKYDDTRIEKTVIVGAYLVNYDASFPNQYSVDIVSNSILPDPSEAATKDEAFIVLTAYKTACIIVGSELKLEAANAISIKDGPSAIDLRGVSGTLNILYQDLCSKYSKLLDDYKEDDRALVGQAILGPYSPGSDFIARTHNDQNFRGNYFRY